MNLQLKECPHPKATKVLYNGAWRFLCQSCGMAHFDNLKLPGGWLNGWEYLHNVDKLPLHGK